MLRQVMWKVPQQLLDKSLALKEEKLAQQAKQSWSLTDTSEQQRGEVGKAI